MAVNMSRIERFNNFCDGYFSIPKDAKSVGKSVLKSTVGLPVSIILFLGYALTAGAPKLCKWTWNKLTSKEMYQQHINPAIANAIPTFDSADYTVPKPVTILVNGQEIRVREKKSHIRVENGYEVRKDQNYEVVRNDHHFNQPQISDLDQAAALAARRAMKAAEKAVGSSGESSRYLPTWF